MIDRTKCTAYILAAVAIGSIVIGALLFAYGDKLIKERITKECQLREGTMIYDLWHNSPVPLYISIYVFDLNDTDFLNGTAKPRLTQRGPFVYRENRQKVDVRNYENNTISYREPRSYTFEPSLSAENETANITTINLVYMALLNYLQTERVPTIFQRIVGELLSVEEKPIMQRTIKEYLWGYQDPLLHLLKNEFPEFISDDQVSAFNGAVNGAGLNTFLISDGVKTDIIGKIERFNFKTNLSYWTDIYANMINGTDSTLWHPYAEKDERIYTFISDICRSVYLEFNVTSKNQYNIDTYKYTLSDDVFSNSADNAGFCLNSSAENGINQNHCLPSGLFSLKTCVHLSDSSNKIPLPIIASSPHFLAADRSIQDSVLGLKPDEQKHRSFISIEPITGIVMNGSRRLQINLNVVNDSNINAVARIHPFVFPMIWIDEHAEIDETSANKFHSKVTTPMKVIKIFKYSLPSFGGLLILIIIGLIARYQHQKRVSGPAFEGPTVDETTPILFS